jgi:competence protein ComEA
MPTAFRDVIERLVPDGHGTRVRWGIGAVVVVALITVAVAVVIAAFGPGAASVVVEPARTEAPVSSDGPIVVVHVLGAVEAPGLYRLSTGSRVIDAVAAAGGFTAAADRAALNLARLVADGEQIAVTEVGQAPPPGVASVADGVVNVNTATAADLETLPRVGPAMAQRIIDWRTTNGPFQSADDLLSVPGIGDKTLDGFREQISF